MEERGAKQPRVMFIHDVSKEVSWSGIRWVVSDAFLKNGAEFMLLGVAHHLNHPLTLDFLSAAKQLGYETGVINSNDVSEEEIDNYRFLEEEEHTPTYMEMLLLSKQCQAQKIKLYVDVRVGVSRKVVAVRYAVDFKATKVVLDREMKKERKYFMKNLRCEIWKVKSNNIACQVREAIDDDDNDNDDQTLTNQMSYDQMIPSSSSQELASSFKPKSLSPKHKPKPIHTNTNGTENNNNNNNKSNNNFEDNIMEETKIEFSNPICSQCKNERPKAGESNKREFTYGELREATDGFSRDNYISEGGFGSVYRGRLKSNNGVEVAVKQHKSNISLQGDKEFKSEVEVLSRARHENLVMLLGFCSQGTHKLLVYEYVCNGSLADHLSSDASETLNWEQRLKIALGAAKGLEYLHAQNIIHRDIRPNNILITHDHQSMLGDFGLARTKNCEEDSNQFSNESVVGTMGYVAPEYAESGKLSTKTDVYSFGVVLLQLITGLTNTHESLKGMSLVQWAKPLLEQKNYPCLIDKRIVDSHDVHQLFGMVQLVEECLRKDPNKRPPMKCVVDTLTDIIEGNSIRQCSPSKTYYSLCNTTDAIQPHKGIKDEDTNEELYSSNNNNNDDNNNSNNNDTSISRKANNNPIEKTERKQSPHRTTEVIKRVGFKSNGKKAMRRNKLLYDEMVL